MIHRTCSYCGIKDSHWAYCPVLREEAKNKGQCVMPRLFHPSPRTMKTATFRFSSGTKAMAAVRNLMWSSQWFSVTPLPDDEWEVSVKPENEEAMLALGGKKGAPCGS